MIILADLKDYIISLMAFDVQIAEFIRILIIPVNIPLLSSFSLKKDCTQGSGNELSLYL